MYNYGMSDESIRDNVSLFFLAGHETTTSALAWEIAILASHPEIQNKARKEVMELPDQWNIDDLKNLGYLDCFIRETLRLYPPIPTIDSRTVEKDYIINDILIPKGTTIELNLIAMAYDSEVWKDPEEFRPERWYPQNISKTQRDAWLPFTGGPRVCIGKEFGLLEQKIILAMLLKRCKEIKLSPNVKVSHMRGIPWNIPDHDKTMIDFVPNE